MEYGQKVIIRFLFKEGESSADIHPSAIFTMPVHSTITIAIGWIILFFPLRKLWADKKNPPETETAEGIELNEMEKPMVEDIDEPENA
jgi:hypothetical protein